MIIPVTLLPQNQFAFPCPSCGKPISGELRGTAKAHCAHQFVMLIRGALVEARFD